MVWEAEQIIIGNNFTIVEAYNTHFTNTHENDAIIVQTYVDNIILDLIVSFMQAIFLDYD